MAPMNLSTKTRHHPGKVHTTPVAFDSPQLCSSVDTEFIHFYVGEESATQVVMHGDCSCLRWQHRWLLLPSIPSLSP